jgi:alpha-beta hydrolase superfamily lysophospholipase
MSHYVLVHGAWEESGMWDRVAPILRKAGHAVTAVDLPGHGANRKPDSVVTTQSYLQALVDIIGKQDHPIILAAHSMSGALISRWPRRFRKRSND